MKKICCSKCVKKSNIWSKTLVLLSSCAKYGRDNDEIFKEKDYWFNL